MSDLEDYNELINHEGTGPEDELAQFLRESANAGVPSGRGKEEIWAKIANQIEETSETKSVSIWRYVAVAAAVAVLATFSVLMLDEPEQVQVATNLGETATEMLPDGSSVILNASSTISYSDEWNREIQLEGEAFFEVTEGEKFVVKTAYGNVRVLGTSFNVFARDGDFKVDCKTGRVEVTVAERSITEEIEPGETIIVEPDTVKMVIRAPESIGNWQKGEFYFSNQPIQEVFAELQRQFSVEIQFEEASDVEFSGYFTNKDVETALDMVCLPLGLEYQKTGQNIFSVSKSAQ